MPNWLTQTNVGGWTPLDRVIRAERLDLGELMLAREQDDRTCSLRASTPLHRAAALALPEAVRTLLGNGANPKQRDLLGELPLHKSVRMGDIASVWLLADRCDVNLPADDGMTPLHWACMLGRTEIARYLIAAGANPEQENHRWGRLTPNQLHMLLYNGEKEAVLSSQEHWREDAWFVRRDQTIGV